MIDIEVRNVRTGVIVRTFGQAKDALDFARSHADVLGEMAVYAVKTIRRERLITEAPVIPMRAIGWRGGGR